MKSKISNTNGGKPFHRPSSSYNKLLDRVAFGIMCIALAKSRSARGAFHQPAFIDNSLTIAHTLSCLPGRWVIPGCSITSFNWTK